MADKSLSPIAIGDSLAQGMRDANQIPGLSRVGAGPKEVFEMLQRFAAENKLTGRDVFLGTGMPNIPEQKKFIEQQIDFVRKQGGNPILLGVGPGTKKKPTTGQNEFLADLAKRKGLNYMGPLVDQFPDITKDPMGLHPRPKQYQQIFKQYSGQASAKTQPEPSKSQTQQTQPKPQPKPTQTQPQSGEPSAADLLSRFTGAVLYSESRGRRYATDKKGNVIGLLTSPKGATGEMQVMPGTITDPGFGVKPARDNSPEEIARVGRDYAAVMLRRYNNDPLLASVAYNWGPGNADKWIKRGADFNKLPKETKNYVASIAGRMNIPSPVLADRPSQTTPTARRTDTTPIPPPVSMPKRVEATTAPTPFNPVTIPLPPRKESSPSAPPFKQVQAFKQVDVPGSSRAELEAMYVPPWMAQARPVAPPPPEVVAEPPAQTAPLAEVAPQVAPRPPVKAETPSDFQVALRSTPEFLKQFPVETSTPPEFLKQIPVETRSTPEFLKQFPVETFAPPRSETVAPAPVKSAPAPVEPAPVRAEPTPAPVEPTPEPRIVAEVPFESTLEEEPIPTSTLEDEAIPQAKAAPEPRIEKEPDYPPMSTLEEPKARPAKQGQRQEPIQNQITRADVERMGPNYQAALAATTLADSREDDDDYDDETIAEKYMERRGEELAREEATLEEEASRASPLSALLDISYRSPFPEQQPVMMADGGFVDPYGFDTGPITEDTRKALSNRQGFNAREALAALKRISKEGVSNAESMGRRSVATVPGVVGDVESIFRDDKSRRFATSAEVDRQYLPKRFTAPTKESEGYAAIGEFIDPTIALKLAKPTAKATLAALKASGPQIESALMNVAPAAQPMNIVKYEGGNWMPTRERSDVVNDYVNNLLKDSRVLSDLDFRKKMADIAESGLTSAKNLLAESNKTTKSIYEKTNMSSASRKAKIDAAENIRPLKENHRKNIVEQQQKLDEAKAELARPQSIANFIEKKLQPYIRNNLGTPSDQVRIRMDKWELEEQPKLIAEKQKQIDKVRADIERAAAARGNIDPLILTRSQEQLRKLLNEMEGIKSRTGSFFQMGPGERTAMLRRYDTVRGSSPRGELGTVNFPATPTVAKSGLGKIWEETVDFSIDAYKPSEAASEYAEIYGKEPPAWLTKAAESNDNKGIYSLDYRSGETLPYQFRHMIDELMSSVDPQTNLPKELRRTPKEIEKMSVDDAAALVDKINGWRASNIAEVNLARANNPAVFEVKTYNTIPNTDLPNERNLRWVELKMPENMAEREGRKVLDDALKYEGEIMKHCVGAYCPKVEKGTRIYSLRDDAGRPYTTIEAVPDMGMVDNIFEQEFGAGARNWKKASDKEKLAVLNSELGKTTPYKISQIKGVRNGAPVEEVIPFVRDFARDPKWTDVADINLIGGL